MKGNDDTEYTGRVEVLVEKNGHYVGVTTQGLPQGRYMVRQKVNGRIVNKLVRKD